jgi:hypothetical protein
MPANPNPTPGAPMTPPKTSIAQLKTVDFDTIERMTVVRLQLLRASIEKMGSNPINDKIASDLFLPAYGLIAQFVGSIAITESDGSPVLDIGGAEIPAPLAHINSYMDDGLRALNDTDAPNSLEIDDAFLALDGSEESLNALRAAIDATQ